MKFLLDACVSSRSLQAFLVGERHDVLSVLAIDPKTADDRIMDIALQDGRVFVTEDKDFGASVAARAYRSPCRTNSRPTGQGNGRVA